MVLLGVVVSTLVVTACRGLVSLHVVYVGAFHDLDKCLLCDVRTKRLHVLLLVDALDQRLQLLGKLVEEVDLAVLAPHPLERLELHDQLPV